MESRVALSMYCMNIFDRYKNIQKFWCLLEYIETLCKDNHISARQQRYIIDNSSAWIYLSHPTTVTITTSLMCVKT